MIRTLYGEHPTTAESVAYVIDEDESQQKALFALLGAAGVRTESFFSWDQFLHFPRPDVPSCLVLDVSRLGHRGLAFQQHEEFRIKPIPTVFITDNGDVSLCAKAMKAGAIDFLLKPLHEQQVLDAVALGLKRDAAHRRAMEAYAIVRDRYSMLTRREQEVVGYIVKGALNKQIAAELRLSEATVKMHRAQVMRKMESRSVADLVQKAILLGLLEI